jgi:LPXTG-motif cell wall-anchored protein
LSGRVLWPGAAVDANGEPTDWPGWIFQNGQWVQADDGFAWSRSGAQIFAVVNPTSPTVTVTYPPPTPTCDANPPEVQGVQVTTTTTAPPAPLPRTGSSHTRGITTVAAALVLVGAALLAASTRRRRVCDDVR